MSLLKKNAGQATPAAAQSAAGASETPVVRIRKGQTHALASQAGGGEYTLVTRWGAKDYDLLALVEYADGHVETVSTFGTVGDRCGFSPRTKDGAVVHVSGDKAATGRRGADLPYEVIHVRLNPNIRAVVPVVYSAKNSGVGSFHEYQVSTYVLAGLHQTPDGVRPEIAVEAVEASRDRHVYTFVPAVIHNAPTGATVEAVELYSRPSCENRPIVRGGHVTMNEGPENADK